MIRHSGQSPLIAGAVESGGVLVTSGVVAPEALTGSSVSFEEQAVSVMRELVTLLERAGRDLVDVMRIEAYLADQADFATWNDVFVRYWPNPNRRPARTTVVVGFVLPTIRFEAQALVGRVDRDSLPPHVS